MTSTEPQKGPMTFDPLTVRLAFEPGENIEAKLAEVSSLRRIIDGLSDLSGNGDPDCELREYLNTRLEEVLLSARSAIGWAVQERYVKALRHLILAHVQALFEDGSGFLTEDEEITVKEMPTDTEWVLRQWEVEKTREDDAALLRKYAEALALCPKSPDPDYDYTPVIRAGREANARS